MSDDFPAMLALGMSGTGKPVQKADAQDGVIAQSCYDMTAVIGLIRAAERQNSPAILQLFPITLKYGGGPFLKFCLMQ